MADITLVNLNMLYIRYGEQTERELHIPLGPLYLTRSLEDDGFAVDVYSHASAVVFGDIPADGVVDDARCGTSSNIDSTAITG